MVSRIAAAAPSSLSPLAGFISRRGLASAADPHAPLKVNLWQDPLSPSKWKEEHTSLSMWGGFRMFSGEKEYKIEAAPAQA